MTITKDDVFIVCSGRSVLTAARGIAHGGGRITVADLRVDKPLEVMKGYVKTGKVELDEEARAARKVDAERAEDIRKQRVKDAEETAAAAKKTAGGDEPPTEAEIIEAIGKLDKDNPEHWTSGGKPQVVTLEGLLGKQISAADRDAAWSAVQAAE
ncbi:MAG: hypothetical protein KAT00_09950 [Planctomycetes bacterium]|nr:hypothetical protein [Planctomycetota bacterium]